MELRSPAFSDGDAIPRRYTKDGDNFSPPLTWYAVPPEARELALLLEEVDTAGRPRFVHWVLYDIPHDLKHLPEGLKHKAQPDVPGPVQHGRNGLDNLGYDGPAPAMGSTHRYRFRLFALDTPLDAEAGLDAAALLAHVRDHLVAEAELRVTYQRPRA